MGVIIRSSYIVGLQAAEPMELELLGSAGAIRVHFDASAVKPDRPPEEQCQMTLESLLDDSEAERALTSSTGDGAAGPTSSAAVDRIRSEHSDVAEATVHYLRWRMNLGGVAAAIVAFNGAAWVAEDGAGGQVPERVHLAMSMGLRRSRGGDWLPTDTREAIARDVGEPLGHELLREAADLQHSSPRSALILAVAALEVGVKECIALVAPHTRWLLEEIQAPPVDRLLAEYLPTLANPASHPSALPVPPDMMEEVRGAIGDRNRLVHRGRLRDKSRLAAQASPRISSARLSELLVTIQDVLYRLDAFAGHRWAEVYFGHGRVFLAEDGVRGSAVRKRLPKKPASSRKGPRTRDSEPDSWPNTPHSPRTSGRARRRSG